MNLGSSLFGQWIDWLYSIVNDYGMAIVLITISVRFVLLPLNLKQRKTTEQQQRMAEQAEAVRKKHKHDKLKQEKELEELYREHGLNMNGCMLPLIQFPVMLCLYRAIRQKAVVNVKTMLLPWVPSLLVRDSRFVLPIATMMIQLLPQLYPYFRMFEPLKLQRPSMGMMTITLIMNGMFVFIIPSGIGLYYFVSGLFQAIEQFAYYRVCVHRKNVAIK